MYTCIHRCECICTVLKKVAFHHRFRLQHYRLCGEEVKSSRDRRIAWWGRRAVGRAGDGLLGG
jgi:hypothetical protein